MLLCTIIFSTCSFAIFRHIPTFSTKNDKKHQIIKIKSWFLHICHISVVPLQSDPWNNLTILNYMISNIELTKAKRKSSITSVIFTKLKCSTNSSISIVNLYCSMSVYLYCLCFLVSTRYVIFPWINHWFRTLKVFFSK